MKKILLSFLLLCISFIGTYAGPIDTNQDYSGIYFLQQGTNSVIVANGKLSVVASSTLENAGFKGVWLIQKVENGYTVRDTESKLYASITSSGTNLSKEPATVSSNQMSLQGLELTFNVQGTDYKAVSAFVEPEHRAVSRFSYYNSYDINPQKGEFQDKFTDFSSCTNNIFYVVKSVLTLDYYNSMDLDIVKNEQEDFYSNEPIYPTHLFNFNDGKTFLAYYDHSGFISNYSIAQPLAATTESYIYPVADKGGASWAFNLEYLKNSLHYINPAEPTKTNTLYVTTDLSEITDFTPYRYIVRPVKVDYAEQLAKIKALYAGLMKSYEPFVGHHAPSKAAYEAFQFESRINEIDAQVKEGKLNPMTALSKMYCWMYDFNSSFAYEGEYSRYKNVKFPNVYMSYNIDNLTLMEGTQNAIDINSIFSGVHAYTHNTNDRRGSSNWSISQGPRFDGQYYINTFADYGSHAEALQIHSRPSQFCIESRGEVRRDWSNHQQWEEQDQWGGYIGYNEDNNKIVSLPFDDDRIWWYEEPVTDEQNKALIKQEYDRCLAAVQEYAPEAKNNATYNNFLSFINGGELDTTIFQEYEIELFKERFRKEYYNETTGNWDYTDLSFEQLDINTAIEILNILKNIAYTGKYSDVDKRGDFTVGYFSNASQKVLLPTTLKEGKAYELTMGENNDKDANKLMTTGQAGSYCDNENIFHLNSNKSLAHRTAQQIGIAENSECGSYMRYTTAYTTEMSAANFCKDSIAHENPYGSKEIDDVLYPTDCAKLTFRQIGYTPYSYIIDQHNMNDPQVLTSLGEGDSIAYYRVGLRAANGKTISKESTQWKYNEISKMPVEISKVDAYSWTPICMPFDIIASKDQKFYTATITIDANKKPLLELHEVENYCCKEWIEIYDENGYWTDSYPSDSTQFIEAGTPVLMRTRIGGDVDTLTIANNNMYDGLFSTDNYYEQIQHNVLYGTTSEEILEPGNKGYLILSILKDGLGFSSIKNAASKSFALKQMSDGTVYLPANSALLSIEAANEQLKEVAEEQGLAIVPEINEESIVPSKPLITLGDVNNDAYINVGDITSLVSMIMNNENEVNNKFLAADINKDNIINVGDLTQLITLIMSAKSKPMTQSEAIAAAHSKNAISLVPSVLKAGDHEMNVALSLKNEEAISALQFDIQLPEGIEVANNASDEPIATICSDRARRHTVKTLKLDDGTVRVAIYSTSNQDINGADGNICTLALNVADKMEEGTYEIRISNIALSSAASKVSKINNTNGYIGIGTINGIKTIETAKSAEAFDLQGRKLNALQKGVNVIKYRNGTTKKVTIK